MIETENKYQCPKCEDKGYTIEKMGGDFLKFVACPKCAGADGLFSERFCIEKNQCHYAELKTWGARWGWFANSMVPTYDFVTNEPDGAIADFILPNGCICRAWLDRRGYVQQVNMFSPEDCLN